MGHLWILIVLASRLCIEARKEEPVDSVAVLCFVMHRLRYCEPRPSNPHVNRFFAFKGVGGVGIRRSGGGSVGGSFGG